MLRLACCAFPSGHRARQSDEVVDTALLAVDGSAWRGAREALSLVAAGMEQRLRAECHRSVRDGFTPLAVVLAVVNLAVALSGVLLAADRLPLYNNAGRPPNYPFVVDWWWIAFTAAAAAIVLGLVLGNRRLAVAAGIANLALVGYDALFLVNGTDWFSGHLAVFTYGQPLAFPVGRHWLPAAIVLALATAAAPLRRLPLTNFPLTLVATVPLVVLAREIPGSFFFLLCPLAAIVALAIAFGGVAPRLAVLAVGGVLGALPSEVVYLAHGSIHRDPFVTWAVAAVLALGLLLPLAQLARRRLT
ncbi:MAG TPA: hypothetical protein VMU74_06040 [Gaiellaceae bacterium]|nr:hypothetical protein [Gaiellaceae bacterium]